MDYAPRITLNKIAIIAITKSIWIKFPPNGDTKAPKIQTIIRITAITYNKLPIFKKFKVKK